MSKKCLYNNIYKYYNDLFINNFNNSNNFIKIKSNSKFLKDTNYSTYKLLYPIFHKKTFLFCFYCKVLKFRNFKKQNLNQNILFESYLSENKVFLNIDINNIFFVFSVLKK